MIQYVHNTQRDDHDRTQTQGTYHARRGML